MDPTEKIKSDVHRCNSSVRHILLREIHVLERVKHRLFEHSIGGSIKDVELDKRLKSFLKLLIPLIGNLNEIVLQYDSDIKPVLAEDWLEIKADSLNTFGV